MSQLDDACRRTTPLDLTMMVVIEDANGTDDLSATPGMFVGLIRGAPVSKVREELERLVAMGVLDKTETTYRVTSLGAGVLEREVADWEPSPSEVRRRELAEARAASTRL